MRQARSAGKNLSYFVSQDASRDERMGRFTHSEDSVRAGSDQRLADDDAEDDDGETGDDDGYDADTPPQTAS